MTLTHSAGVERARQEFEMPWARFTRAADDLGWSGRVNPHSTSLRRRIGSR